MKYHKPNKYIVYILKQLAKLIVTTKASVDYVNPEKLNIEPPYLVVSNHVNNLDPIFINMMFDEPIAYVVSDRFCKSKFLGKLLRYVGAISKTKGRMDLQTIRDLKKAVAAKRIVGLFPEGMRTWDGKTMPERFELAKLCKMLHVPLVLVHIQGGHLNQPRWSDTYYRNDISLEVKAVISLESIMANTIEESNKKIRTIMTYNEQQLSSSMISLKGLDRLLNYCVSCQSLDTLIIGQTNIRCTHCETNYQFNSYTDILHPIKNISNWLDLQTHYLKAVITNLAHHFELECKRQVYDLNRQLIKKDWTTLSIYNGQLYINKAKIIEFDGVNIQNNNKLEFVTNGEIHWLIMSPKDHIYMWHTLLSTLKGL